MLNKNLELETIECPYCAETILKKAKKCKHCNEILDNDVSEFNLSKQMYMFKKQQEMERRSKKNYPWFWHLVLSLITGFWVFFWIALYFNRDRDIYN